MNRFTATSLQNAWLNIGDHRGVFTQPRPLTVINVWQSPQVGTFILDFAQPEHRLNEIQQT